MGTMVEVQRQKAKALETAFESRRNVIASVLPKHMGVDRVMRLALTAAVKNDKLYQCTPASILLSTLNAASLGVEVDGYHAHLVPYGNVCQLIIDYKGWVDLVYRSNQVERISAHVVREGDRFHYALGTEEKLDHVPDYDLILDDPLADEQQYTHAYACGWLKGAKYPVFVVLTRSQVLRRKAVSKSSGGKTSPWNVWPEEMWKKTALRALVKLLPTSTEMANAALLENQVDMGAKHVMLEQDFSALVDSSEEEEDKPTRRAEIESKLPKKPKQQSPPPQPEPEPAEEEVDEYTAEFDRCRERIAGCKTLDELQQTEDMLLDRWKDDSDFKRMIVITAKSRRRQLTPAKGSLLPEEGE